MNKADQISTKRVSVLYNPFAGKGNALSIAAAACQFVKDKGWVLVECRGSQYAGDIALNLAASAGQQADLIILIGGDGTLRELISGLLSHQLSPEIAFIPMGNANVVARELGIPLKPLAALYMLNNSSTRSVDVGQVLLKQADQSEQSQFFLAMLEIGLGAKIVHMVNQLRLGKLKRLYQLWGDLVYALAGILAFAGKPLNSVHASVPSETGQAKSEFDTSHLVVANMHTYAKGWSFTPEANCQDGRLDIAVGTNNKRLAAIGSFIAAAYKRKQASKRMLYIATQEININATGQRFMQIDGDPVLFSGSAHISLIPEAFIIHAPCVR